MCTSLRLYSELLLFIRHLLSHRDNRRQRDLKLDQEVSNVY